MGKGIVVKIWNIKATENGKSASAQISDSLKYITNEEKCKGVLQNSQTMQPGVSEGQMHRELKYVMNDIKTLDGLYTGGIHILDVKNATTEMMNIKAYYDKLGGRVALHGIISLDESESDQKNAGNLILLLCDMMEEVFPEHQAVYAVHTNTENLHIHFIANTVSIKGTKIHMDRAFMRKVLEPCINRLACKYGFTPNELWTETPKQDRYPIAERKIRLRKDIDLAIEQASDYEEFTGYLHQMGYIVNSGESLYLRNDDMTKGMPSFSLGSEYTIDRIIDRIETKHLPFEKVEVSGHVEQPADREMVMYVPKVLKKYKELTKEEQRQVVKQLRLGKNPWQSRYHTNWRIAGATRELNQMAAIRGLVSAYTDGTIQDAKDEIIRRQKEIAAEKKAVRALSKSYRPQIRIYEEMKQYARKAYLYETGEAPEYESEYEKYQKLVSRLQEGYQKTPQDIADFLANQSAQLLYLQAQREELSEQYRVLTKYENRQHALTNMQEKVSIFEAIGHTKALMDAKKYHILTTQSCIVTSDDQEENYLRVRTVPAIIRGSASVETTVEVMMQDGTVKETIRSTEMTAKEFHDEIYRIRKEYRFYQCSTSRDMQEAVAKKSRR